MDLSDSQNEIYRQALAVAVDDDEDDVFSPHALRQRILQIIIPAL